MALALTVMAFMFAAGCGSKPQYCTDRTALENAVKDLPSEATTKGVSGLEAQITTVQNDANALADPAKSDFPTETDAIESSITQLQTSVKNLPAKPSTADLAAVAINATAVVNSVKSFKSATDSKCN